MFCPSCGAETSRDLNYCSRCGASTAPETALVPVSLTKPVLAIGLTVAVITLGGFALLIAGAVKLAELFHLPDPSIAVLVLGIMTIAFCDLMLLRLLGKIVTASLASRTEKPAKPNKMMGRDTSRQLGSPSYEPVSSVTDHTTRTFAPIYKNPSDRSGR